MEPITIYDSGFGRLGSDVLGGTLKFPTERYPNYHVSVYGDGGRFSYDADLQGNIIGQPHFTDQGMSRAVAVVIRFKLL